jgi:tetratricopeptide (TPR) repeat protein
MDAGSASVSLSLRGSFRAALFLLAVFVPGLWLIISLARAGVAGTWGDSLDLARLQQAVAVDMRNPEWHYNLGTVYLWAGGGNPAAAVKELREATRLNAHVAMYWSALGKACYAADDLSCADQAFERAARLAPVKPRMLWEAGLHYAITRRPADAMPHLQQLLRLEPWQASQVFEMLLRAGTDAPFVWRELVSSATPEVRLDFMSFLVSHDETRPAEEFWAELVGARTAIPQTAATRYVEQLLRHGHYRAAAEVWTYLRRTGVLASDPASNLVYNGGFDQPPLRNGFDWHLQPHTYLSVDAADRDAHGGEHALRLDFTVPDNSEYEPAYQYVPVVPKQTYLLSAYVRAEHITSDSGPRLGAQDPQCPSCLSLTTEGTVGTRGWHRLEAQFTAPPSAEVIRLSVWRPRSRSFPMEISGQFWLDDVSLRPISADEIQAAARVPQP